MIFNSKMMNLNIKDAVGFLTFKNLEKYDSLIHAFSTRLGGVSKNEFKSMNLGFSKNDPKENVGENYKNFFSAVCVDPDSILQVRQVHDNNIVSITNLHDFTDISEVDNIPEADGIITNLKGISIITHHADCTPIYMFDHVKQVICMLHSGWRGTVKKISQKAVERMTGEFGCRLENIICAIGPSIGQCCFETDDDVYIDFKNLDGLENSKFIYKGSKDKHNINLSEVTRQILINAGIREENISVSDICTSCCRDLLFSHRATKGKRGTMVALMGIKKD